MRQYHQLLALELPRLPDNLAKYFVANRFRRFDKAAALACRTRMAQEMFQALTRALARHFHQSQRRYRGNVGLDVILIQRAFQGLDDLPAVFGLLHVDKIDDDYAAQIAPAALPGDRGPPLPMRA